MKVTVKHRPLQDIYRDLGIEEKGKVQQFLGKTVADNLRQYVSFNSGTQQRATQVEPGSGGKRVEINVPYAQFQAGGKVMVGLKSRRAWARKGERKVVINKALSYHSGALRGPHPFERMVADKKDFILNQVASYARRFK